MSNTTTEATTEAPKTQAEAFVDRVRGEAATRAKALTEQIKANQLKRDAANRAIRESRAELKEVERVISSLTPRTRTARTTKKGDKK